MIKLRKTGTFRVFFISFFITLIISGLFLGIHFVSLKAQRGGFDVPAPIAAEYKGLDLTLKLMDSTIEIDLTPLNRAAEKIQEFEGWVLPENFRFLNRFSCFAADKISTAKRQQKEREYYKNAGLV